MQKLLLLIIITACFNGYAQKPIFSIGPAAYYGYIFVHSPQMNAEDARPAGLSLDLKWLRIDSTTWNTCNCFPRMGLSLVYFDYDSRILGQSASLTYFIEPSLRITKRWQFALRGSLGLSYLTNPYHPLTNPDNLSYSFPVSGYLGFGLGSNIQLSRQWNLSLFANYFHVSNGGIKDPNKGIDWPTVSIGVDYTPVRTDLPVWPRIKRDYQSMKVRKDVYALFSYRFAHPDDRLPRLVYGAGLNISKQVSRLNALCAGVEWHHDLAADESLRNQQRHNEDGHFGGVLAGNEFLLGKFIFSQQLGTYFYKNNTDYHWLYHRYGLWYRITEHFGIGVNFKAYSKYAHFFDGRVVVNF